MLIKIKFEIFILTYIQLQEAGLRNEIWEYKVNFLIFFIFPAFSDFLAYLLYLTPFITGTVYVEHCRHPSYVININYLILHNILYKHQAPFSTQKRIQRKSLKIFPLFKGIFPAKSWMKTYNSTSSSTIITR